MTTQNQERYELKSVVCITYRVKMEKICYKLKTGIHLLEKLIKKDKNVISNSP